VTVVRFVGFEGEGSTIVLRWVGDRRFRLEEPFRYQDTEFGTITIPPDLDRFETDLGSIPTVTSWYTPQLGRHLPAYVLHDALIAEPGDPPTYTTRDGRTISRDAADRIFLDAMTELGTPFVTRSIIWSAVALYTAGTRSRWRWFAWYAVALLAAFVLAADAVDLCWTVRGVETCAVSSWLGDAAFPVEWARGAVVLAVGMIPVGLILFPARYLRAVVAQAVLYGLIYLPTVAMLVPLAVLAVLRAIGRPADRVTPARR